MKICYLILAHGDFTHLDALIRSLDSEDSTFCIHVDKKTRGSYTNTNTHVSIIPQSVSIHWGGFSMVQATLALLAYAKEKNVYADYFIFISGVDYPIRPPSFLHNLLSLGKEYIDIAPIPVPYKPIERYEYYYFDYNRRTVKHYNPLFLLEVLMKKLQLKRKAPFTLFAGTQWFALTAACVQYILDTVNKDKRYEKFFRHTLVPDEAFFQTIIGNSPFASSTASSLTYTDWEVPVPPAHIEGRHIDFLKSKMVFNDEYGQRYPYFARKFSDTSTLLRGRIEDELRDELASRGEALQ